jgi:hypothetical protein
MKVNGIELNKNLSPTGEYNRVRKHLEKVAHAYRECKKADEKILFASELRKYGFLNMNNNTGKWVIVL